MLDLLPQRESADQPVCVAVRQPVQSSRLNWEVPPGSSVVPECLQKSVAEPAGVSA